MPVPPRVGPGHAEMVPVGSHWNPLGFSRASPSPSSCQGNAKHFCFVGFGFATTARLELAKCSKRALKRRLKALMKHRTPQKDNLNFCHFKLCMAGVLEQPPRLMSREFKQQLKKSVINTEQFAFCLPVAFPGFPGPSTDGELLISHFGPHHR